MTYWIFLISTLAVVYCRPQINTQESPAVEIEKQHVVEIHPEPKQLFQDSKTKLLEKQLEESTKQILEKIALVNEKQGLTKKKPKPYQHFPFSYLRSQDGVDARQSTDFKFPRDPFTNPILDYIEGKHNNAELKIPSAMSGYLNQNKVNEEDDVPAGHYIKRKITHHQTMVIPNPGYMPGNMFSPQQNIPQYFYGMNRAPEIVKKPSYNEMTKGDLEKQTIDNIKNIMENSQYPASMPYNPYTQPVFTPYMYQQPQSFGNIHLYGPYTSQQTYRPGKQQWQWPLGTYFPIVIKDPFIQMMNAFTSMIEYGPSNSGAGDSCKKHIENKNLFEEAAEERNSISSRANKAPNNKLSYSIVNSGEGAEITVSNDDDSNMTTIIDIEDLQITDNSNDPVQLKLNLRQSKQNQEVKKTVFLNASKATGLLKNPIVETVEITKTERVNDTSRQSPPVRDQVLFDDEIDNEEEDKAEDIHVSHQGTKKLVSKDNTGSGIFVHKIKVRKGGVAIAGPGGIATAGSGGTAIVGPNGFAYTHPDSLAIAGSGTKVVAVEPTINLSQVILDHNKNKTRGDGHLPPRVGKIVAVGPVIYYNKG